MSGHSQDDNTSFRLRLFPVSCTNISAVQPTSNAKLIYHLPGAVSVTTKYGWRQNKGGTRVLVRGVELKWLIVAPTAAGCGQTAKNSPVSSPSFDSWDVWEFKLLFTLGRCLCSAARSSSFACVQLFLTLIADSFPHTKLTASFMCFTVPKWSIWNICHPRASPLCVRRGGFKRSIPIYKIKCRKWLCCDKTFIFSTVLDTSDE